MPRRPPPEYYDNPPDSDSDDPPRRRRRAHIDDDIEYRRRKPGPPLDELDRLRLRDRSREDTSRDYFSPRGGSGSRGTHRHISRGRYVEEDSDQGGSDEDAGVPMRKGSWTANPAGYGSDDEESLRRDRRRRNRSPPEPDYGRRGSYPRRPGDWDVEDEETTRRVRRRWPSRSPPGDFSPRRSARDKWNMEDGMGREDFHDRGFSRSPPRPRYRVDDEESLRGHGRRRRRSSRSPPEWDDARGVYRRHSVRDELDMEYGMGRGDGDRGFSGSPTRSRYRGDDEMGIRKDTKGHRPSRREVHEDEFLIRKHKSPPRFRDDAWNQDEWARSSNSDHGYGSPRLPRAPSPELRSPRSSLDGVGTRNRGSRRRRQSNEVILDEWQDRGNSPSSVRRLSPEPDDWRGPEDASRSRRRPLSLDRSEDPAVSEWGDTRPSKGVRDEFEENPYGRQGAGRHSSSDSVAGDWAIVNSPAASRGLMRDEFDGPSREIRQPRHSKERGRRTPSSDRRVSEDDAERRAQIGRRYVGTKDRRERLWTEITKDLVVREAIERAGYEFEETEFFYYIFDYLQYDDVSALVDLSDNIRQARRRRIHEIHRERTSLPPPAVSAARRSAPLLLDRGPSPRTRGREAMERGLAIDERRRRPLPRPEW